MYTRILVGTDGSKTAALAVDKAAEVAATSGASLTILSVGPKAGAVVQAEQARVVSTGVDVMTLALSGDPASVIIDTATSGAYDLLVVGNKGMTGASRFFLGSVPNKISHHAPCALLIVRTT